MTHVDLLKFIIDVQNIPKNELAELIGVPLKKMDDVLSGATPLKKKWLKNLSLFTGIPEQAILAGEFNLQYSVETQESQVEGEQPPVAPEQTPEMLEALKDYNYGRLMTFCETRHKKRYRDIKQGIVIQIAAAIVGLLFSIACGVIVVLQKPMMEIFMFPLICFIPSFMTLLPVRGLYKIAKTGSKRKEKNFKIYTLLSILPMLIHTVAGVCFKVYPVWAIGFAAASLLPPMYFVFVKDLEKKTTQLQSSLSIAFSFLTSCAFGCSIVIGDFIERDTEEIVVMASLIAVIVAWGVVAMALCFVNYFYYCYHKVIVTSKYFQPLPEKPLFKKHHIRNKIIALVLAAIIFVGGTYILSCAIMYWNVVSILNYEDTIVPKYSDYNKQDIIFTEEDDVTIIDTEFYTLKLPADMKKNEEIKTQDSYKSDPTGGIVMMYTEDNLYGESLSKLYEGEDVEDLDERQAKYMAEIKQEVIDTYGYYPQSQYELKKIIRDIRENGINFLNRKQTAAVIPILIFDTTLSYDDEVIFYEDNEKELVLSVRKTEHSNTGRTTFMCLVNGNKKGEYEKFVDVTIMLRSDYADEELAYKIINSIEMK